MKKALIPLLFLTTIPAQAMAEDADFGMKASFKANAAIVDQFSIGIETELRSLENSKYFDRFSVGINFSYSILKWLKVSAGYIFLYDNRTKNKTDDAGKTIELSTFWSDRHRFYADITGTLKLGDFKASIREMYKYTYRREQTVSRYAMHAESFDEVYEEITYPSDGKHTLRSRLSVQYDILHTGIAPYASAELFSWDKVQRTEFSGGIEWKAASNSTFDIGYTFMWYPDNSNDDRHYLTLGYKFSI